MEPEKKSPPVVTYLTRVGLILSPDEDYLAKETAGDGDVAPDMIRKAAADVADRYARVAQMMEFLEAQGFNFRFKKNTVYCYSSEIEAGEIKRRLIAAGFRDREFQIHLEYTRGWGML